MITRLLTILSSSLLFSILVSAAAQGITRYVANNGVDDGSCGMKTAPCRTIAQAINNAGAGDTVIVLPGSYRESIDITKQLTLTSRDGVDSTIIDAGGNAFGIKIEADGCVVGAPGKGFSVTNANPYASGTSNQLGSGILIAADNVTVDSNLATANDRGVVVTGTGDKVLNNFGVQNGEANFVIYGQQDVLQGNVATMGARTALGSAIGFEFWQGSGHVVTKNVANDCEVGFTISAPNVSDLTFTQNSASGNTVHGLDVVFVAVASQNWTYTFSDSTFQGTSTGHGIHIANQGCNPGAQITVNATNDYWGSPLGPGGGPGADNFVRETTCNTGSPVAFTTTPFSTTEIKIPIKPLK